MTAIGRSQAADPAVVRSIVDGRPLANDAEPLVSENPARPDEPAGLYVPAPVSAVDDAVAIATTAGKTWRARSALERGRILRRAAVLVAEHQEELAQLLTAEEGKTLADARREVSGAAEIIEYHASSAWWSDGETFAPSRPGDIVRTLRVPLGVIGIITPWNFPISIPAWKIAPALVHGNTVVWKPASVTSLLAVRFAQTLLDAGVETGALAVLLGDGTVGQAIVDHPMIDAISFTGSEQVGRRIGLRASERNVKCQLELGGHNPAVILADADLDLAVEALVRSIANATGQKCTAARRLIVEASIRDELVDRLAARFAALRVGDGIDASTEVGPLVNAGARDQVASEIERACAQGCELVVQTRRVPDAGAFLGPTLLAADSTRPDICREEVFGPVSVILTAAGVDDALRLAGETRFGLSASLFTSSERTARRAADELAVGMLNINGPTTASELHAPFGGTKASSGPGPGEQGSAAREFYTDIRTIIATAIG